MGGKQYNYEETSWGRAGVSLSSVGFEFQGKIDAQNIAQLGPALETPLRPCIQHMDFLITLHAKNPLLIEY